MMNMHLMKVGYIGNFEPEHSTENHVRSALLHHEVTVEPFQESNHDEWNRLIHMLQDQPNYLDFIMWTRTGWQPKIPHELQLRTIEAARTAGVPVVGYHLDRWFGLNREGDVRNEPFFKADLNVTADGGHQAEFEALGVNHVWFSPGVSLGQCVLEPQDVPEYKHDVVFCGSSQSYHKEWGYRLELVNWLRNTFGDRLGVYPEDKPALRGQPLVDLYGNAKVIVGDSCLNGGITNYWSDRIPETLGRAGFLIHPNVEGLTDQYTPGEHLVTYDLGDFETLRNLIETYAADDSLRNKIRYQGQYHVLQHHTYEVRMQQLVELLGERGMI